MEFSIITEKKLQRLQPELFSWRRVRRGAIRSTPKLTNLSRENQWSLSPWKRAIWLLKKVLNSRRTTLQKKELDVQDDYQYMINHSNNQSDKIDDLMFN